jgi:hypothetical protein
MLARMWGKRNLIHCCWECKLAKRLWKTIWRLLKQLKTGIQDGYYGVEADSMSSKTPKLHWDAGATLGRNKAARRIKTSTSWTPSLWKASPWHVRLRKQEGGHAARHWLQTCLWDIQQINRWAPSITQFFPSHPRINQHRPLGRLTQSPLHTHKNLTINKELKTNTQQRDGVAGSAPEKGSRARNYEWTVSKQRMERQKGQWGWVQTAA